MGFSIECYYNYNSYASKFRAMRVDIDDYRLYFSFENIICFETINDKYITKEKFHYAEKHKNYIKDIRYNYKTTHEVEQSKLEQMIFKDMLKIPFVGSLNIYSYGGYSSNASKYKAMCIQLGEFKLYYSYNTLIAFETKKDQFITNKRWSHTTDSHRHSARNFRKNIEYVSQDVLKLITLTSLLKLPFEEAKDVAGFRCERVHFA